MTLKHYLNWSPDSLVAVRFQKILRKRGKKRGNRGAAAQLGPNVLKNVPSAYAGLIDQFVAECLHSDEDNGHEALRRQSYVMEMLDYVALELTSYDGEPEDYRSKALTPVLQRYIRGVPDSYGPTVCAAMEAGGDVPTIEEVTHFYLTIDPVDVTWIPSYRYGAIRIPQARWHIKVLMDGLDSGVIGDRDVLKNVLDNHDLIMEQMAEAGDVDVPQSGIPHLTEVEVEVLICEKIELFFLPELLDVVSHVFFPLFNRFTSTHCPPQETTFKVVLGRCGTKEQRGCFEWVKRQLAEGVAIADLVASWSLEQTGIDADEEKQGAEDGEEEDGKMDEDEDEMDKDLEDQDGLGDVDNEDGLSQVAGSSGQRARSIRGDNDIEDGETAVSHLPDPSYPQDTATATVQPQTATTRDVQPSVLLPGGIAGNQC